MNFENVNAAVITWVDETGDRERFGNANTFNLIETPSFQLAANLGTPKIYQVSYTLHCRT